MSSQVPVYLAELSPARIRGRIVGIQQWAIEWGILIMYLISYGCSKVSGPASFRIAWGIQGIPAFVLWGALYLFPESPRWLASKDRWEECLNVLALLHGNGDTQHPVVQAEYLEGEYTCYAMRDKEPLLG
jgi:MFS family permease